MEKLILEDLFKIYISCIDSYNSKILQTINDKYTIIDKAMLAVYLYVKILEDRKESSIESEEVLINYLLKQIIYGETGNLALEITDKTKIELYKKVIDELILEKFEYKNRILKKLKYNYKIVKNNEYTKLLDFCEKIANLSIFNSLSRRGNLDARDYLDKKEKNIKVENLDKKDKFFKEKFTILTQIKDNKFEETEYYNLLKVALNLKDVYRYSTLTTTMPENVLFHQYIIAVTSIIFSQYLNNKLDENIDIYKITLKSLFHDFGEYKGNEIVTQVKNYNEDTIKMFKEIEEKDELELKSKIGTNLYDIISNYKEGAEGYVSELLDKMFGIMKLWIEVKYMGNNTYVKSICSIFQERFKRFKKVEKINSLKNKDFYLDLVKECYIYVKENLMENDLDIFFKYFTEEDKINIRTEIMELRRDRTSFLK